MKLELLEANKSTLNILVNGEKVGTVSDSCCRSVIATTKIKKVRLEKGTGKGGYVVTELRGKITELVARLYNVTDIKKLKKEIVINGFEDLDIKTYIDENFS